MPEARTFSVALPISVHQTAAAHLLREDGQEDVTFAIYCPSAGATRDTALIRTLILPREGERQVHGNASFNGSYFERALSEAAKARGGLAFMHSHPWPGWQGMSPDDHDAEAGHAAATLAATGLPLVGLTLGNDGAWSARSWHRSAPKTYAPRWAGTARVVGRGLRVTHHPHLVAPYAFREELKRTVSFWGEEAQRDLGRLHVGVVGLGSVGMLVHESLARMGVRKISAIDFDRIRRHNLDRTSGATPEDVEAERFKVEIAVRNGKAGATAQNAETLPFAHSVVEPEGYRRALDCDVLFSCVDRPWPRRVLNHIAYAHLIPVIDGGIAVQLNPSNGKFKNATWSARTAAPEQRCLECAEAYDPGLVDVDRSGYLDDPSYIQGLPADSALRRNENVFPMSMSLAAHEIFHFVALGTSVVGMHDIGEQRFTYYPGYLTSGPARCDDSCPFPGLLARGERADADVGAITGPHKAAEESRSRTSREKHGKRN